MYRELPMFYYFANIEVLSQIAHMKIENKLDVD
jgi:hypothetical protein